MAHRLSGSHFINPFWFDRVMHGTHQTVAISPTEIELEGEKLRLTASENIRLVEGERVYVWLSADGFFYLETEQEKQAREERWWKEKEEEERRYKERLNRWRQEAEEFNNRINTPFKWTAGQNNVLSGLTENSWGDGRKKNSVNHIWLKEDYANGRFKRSAGDLLCKKKGKLWVDKAEWVDGNGQLYMAQITCRECIKILEKKGWITDSPSE